MTCGSPGTSGPGSPEKTKKSFTIYSAPSLPKYTNKTGKAEDRDAALDVRETLASLGENDRLILTLFYLNDMAIKDIAQLLRISQGAVKQRLVTGRNHFKEQYEARERRAQS